MSPRARPSRKRPRAPLTSAVGTLRDEFGGEIILPGDVAFDTARLVWNAMIDARPAVIARPRGAVDAAAAVRFGREAGLEIAVRGGGHNPAGQSTVDDGLLIDLALMRGVLIEPDGEHAWVQGGCRLADVDRETTRIGRAVPCGVNYDTGIGGLALGGGYGYLGRRYGLTCDALDAVELVTADGDVRRIDATTDPELSWGLRGGGGNFGIVTAFRFRLRPVPPVVHYVDLAFARRDASAVMRAGRDLAPTLPREALLWLGIQEAGPMPGLPDAMVGRAVLMAGVVAIDARADLAALTAPLEAAARPLARAPVSTTFRALQHGSTEPPDVRRRRYWKAHYVRELPDAFLDAFIGDEPDDAAPLADVEMLQLGGAIADLPTDATAYAQRDATFDVIAVAYWDDPAEDERRIAATRAIADRLRPFASGVYLNNLLDEGEGRVREAFRDERFERLRRLKHRLDPDNVFHRNANIPPAAAS
jgi:FAD/FMN-containing dehydrogenase